MSFTQEVIDRVWEKACVDSDKNERNGYRKDQCSAWIKKEAYGKINDYGWEIDHITPVSNGGTDSVSNLRPLHWANNRARSNGRLNTAKPEVKSVGIENHRLDDRGDYTKI